MRHAAQAGVAGGFHAYAQLAAEGAQEYGEAVAGAGRDEDAGWVDVKPAHVAQVGGDLAGQIAGGVDSRGAPRGPPFRGEDSGGVGQAGGQ